MADNQTPTPEEMLEVFERLMNDLEYDFSKPWCDRAILGFMQGYYGIGKVQ